MINTTNQPVIVCPSWCTNHREFDLGGEHGAVHEGTLFTSWATIGGDWLHHLTVSTIESADHPAAPVLSVATNKFPRTLTADEAREFAAALLRGADIIEGRTVSSDARWDTYKAAQAHANVVSRGMADNIAAGASALPEQVARYVDARTAENAARTAYLAAVDAAVTDGASR